MPPRALPVTTDHDTGGYWQAANRGQLALRTCQTCGLVLHLPRAYCHRCGSWDTEWRTIAPAGTLWSYTTTERELRPGFPVPYTVVVVELDDAPGVRLVGHLPGRPALQIGMPMRATFERVTDQVTLPQWEPVTAR
jgi:uncharacterized OB-fold protein